MSTPNPLGPAAATPLSPPSGQTAGPRPCLTCVDIEWLFLSGERWDDVAARLCMLPDSLERHLQRHDRRDLLAWRTR